MIPKNFYVLLLFVLAALLIGTALCLNFAGCASEESPTQGRYVIYSKEGGNSIFSTNNYQTEDNGDISFTIQSILWEPSGYHPKEGMKITLSKPYMICDTQMPTEENRIIEK